MDSSLMCDAKPSHGAFALPGLKFVFISYVGTRFNGTVGTTRRSRIDIMSYLVDTGRLLKCGCKGVVGTFRAEIRSFSSELSNYSNYLLLNAIKFILVSMCGLTLVCIAYITNIIIETPKGKTSWLYSTCEYLVS